MQSSGPNLVAARHLAIPQRPQPASMFLQFVCV